MSTLQEIEAERDALRQRVEAVERLVLGLREQLHWWQHQHSIRMDQRTQAKARVKVLEEALGRFADVTNWYRDSMCEAQEPTNLWDGRGRPWVIARAALATLQPATPQQEVPGE